MNKYILTILLLFSLAISGCKKQYTVEIERIEVWRGNIKHVTKDYQRSTFKVKNNEEAANEAYGKYVFNIITCCETDKQNSPYLWIPVNYRISDSKGNIVHKNLHNLKDAERYEILIGEEEDSIYYKLLGHFKYAGTPYGIRNPKPSPF